MRCALEDIEPPIWREIALINTTTLPERNLAMILRHRADTVY